MVEESRDWPPMPGYYRPEIGCAFLLLALLALCVLPFLFVEAMQIALAKLHLWPSAAALCMLGIFLGSLINIPVRRLQRQSDQLVLVQGWHRWLGQVPLLRRERSETIIAVNLGGCVIPCLLGVFEILMAMTYGADVLWAMAAATLANIGVCYFVARPVEGVGIAMPSFVSPVVAVALSWLLLTSAEYNEIRAPVAFVAGITGPLVGADLLHLRDLTRVSVGVLSIGGAGTFDGIVLSGMLAAILA
jgi:uncharacterized membrane protein